ncbi:MAG: hypothetical protein ACRCW2_02510 [Cellulosilyticaceae bacterium]
MSTKLIETVLELLSEKVRYIESENQKLHEQVSTLTGRIAELEGRMDQQSGVEDEEIEEERLTRTEARDYAIGKISAVVAPTTSVRVGSRKEGSGIVMESEDGMQTRVKYTLNRKSTGMTQWTSLEGESLDAFDYFIFTSQVADRVVDLVFTQAQVLGMGRPERSAPQFVRFSFTFEFEGDEVVNVVENTNKAANLCADVGNYQVFKGV